MNSTVVYMKTSRGREEIATRSHGLTTRLRAVLILVDGRRSAAELAALNPAPQEAEAYLAALQEGGFISPISPVSSPADPGEA